MKHHLYGFEHPVFYVHIKAQDIQSAIEEFTINFGESALNEVHSIHNLYSQSKDSKIIKQS